MDDTNKTNMSAPPAADCTTITTPSFILPLALLLLGLWWSVLFSARWRQRRLPLPPGPRGLPLIGNMNMMDQINHRGLASLAATHGNPGLLYLRLGNLHAFAVSTPSVAQQVLQTQDQVFSNRPATIAIRYLTYDRADMAFAHYGSFWRQMRKLFVVRLFSRRRTASWESVRDEVRKMTRVFAATAGRPADVGEMVSSLTKNITFRAAFGAATPEEDQEAFITIIQEFSKLFGAFNIGDFIPWLRWLDLDGINARMRKARAHLDSFIDHVIDDHMTNPKPVDSIDLDMVDEMLTFLEDGEYKCDAGGATTGDLHSSLRLTRNNIKAIIMDVMFGGTETVASAIEWVMAELMRNPTNLTRVQKELEDTIGLDRQVHEMDLDKLPCLRCCIKETLRLHPPIPLLLHETAEDCEVEGYAVPAKSRIMVNVWAINRDRDSWGDDACEFKPERFEKSEDCGGDQKKTTSAVPDFRGGCFEFLPFGSGRRSCPGMQLGLYALELAVAQMLHCFYWELPAGMKPAELDMTDVFGLTAPRAVRLVAVPTPRLSCPID